MCMIRFQISGCEEWNPSRAVELLVTVVTSTFLKESFALGPFWGKVLWITMNECVVFGIFITWITHKSHLVCSFALTNSGQLELMVSTPGNKVVFTCCRILLHFTTLVLLLHFVLLQICGTWNKLPQLSYSWTCNAIIFWWNASPYVSCFSVPFLAN